MTSADGKHTKNLASLLDIMGQLMIVTSLQIVSKTCISFLACTVLLVALGPKADGQDRKSSDDRGGEEKTADFSIEKSVPIEMLFGSYHNVVDLGTLPCGVSGVVEIRLSNPHTATFAFEGIELGCKCTTAKISKTDLEPGDETILTIGLETPNSSKSQQRTHSVKLIEKGGENKNVRLVLRYMLSGLMAFIEGSHVVEVQDGLDRQEFRLPFLVSAPVKMEDVKFQITPNNPGVDAKLISENGKHFVNIKFDTVFVPDDGLALTIVARHSTEDLEDAVRLLLCPRKQLEVTPRTLRFKKDEESLKATALLRHRQIVEELSDDSKGGREQRSRAISVEARIGSLKAGVKVKQIGPGIYRLSVTLPDEELREYLERDNSSNAISWYIVTPKGSFSPESRFTVDSFVDVSADPK